MKIGIFGGTFNPPHKGHIRLAEIMSEKIGLDKILIIPSCIPPHKSPGALVSAEDRINMCRLAFSGGLFEVSSLEIDRGSTSYTVDTLKVLSEQYPGDELFFIVGSDMLETFRYWYRWEDILSMCTLCAASRKEGFRPDLSAFSEEQRRKIIYVDAEPLELSSTQVRIRIKSNYNCGDYLDDKVIGYIKDRNLYDDDFDVYRVHLARMLDAERIFHCENVSESAGELARLYGADEKKARLAGLMHDITKNMPAGEQISLIGEMTALERNNHKVWHQMSAPVFLEKEGIITDAEILSAIRWHTTGKAGMTLLEKIVYTADFISSERDYPDVETVRKLARISLEHAMLYTSRYTIKSLVKADHPVHPSTLECYNDLLAHFGL